MSKNLKANIWEIQAILYLILAQMVETDWIMWTIRGWALFTFIMAMKLFYEAYKEEKEI